MADPEEVRIGELLALVRSGEADDGAREELALYAEERPDLRERIAEAERTGKLGAGWLVRVEADRQIQRRERSPLVVAERVVGLGMAGAGWLVALAAPVTGGALMAAGVGLLTWSFVRTRLLSWRSDPYRDIDK